VWAEEESNPPPCFPLVAFELQVLESIFNVFTGCFLLMLDKYIKHLNMHFKTPTIELNGCYPAFHHSMVDLIFK
jgi:hypothetical protein